MIKYANSNNEVIKNGKIKIINPTIKEAQDNCEKKKNFELFSIKDRLK